MATVTLLLFVSMVFGKNEWILMENNINPDQEYKAVGSWSNWITGYHVNDEHDGHLNIGSISFDPTQLGLPYLSPTNCTNQYPVFADGKIICVSNNMLYAYNAVDGSIAFFYLYFGSQILRDPTFATSGLDKDVLAYSYGSGQLYMSSFDATTGLII